MTFQHRVSPSQLLVQMYFHFHLRTPSFPRVLPNGWIMPGNCHCGCVDWRWKPLWNKGRQDCDFSVTGTYGWSSCPERRTMAQHIFWSTWLSRGQDGGAEFSWNRTEFLLRKNTYLPRTNFERRDITSSARRSKTWEATWMRIHHENKRWFRHVFGSRGNAFMDSQLWVVQDCDLAKNCVKLPPKHNCQNKAQRFYTLKTKVYKVTPDQLFKIQKWPVGHDGGLVSTEAPSGERRKTSLCTGRRWTEYLLASTT